MTQLRNKLDELKGGKIGLHVIDIADDFSYSDPVDGSTSSKQGIRLIFSDGARIVFRLSGTGTDGATLRVYFEKYVADNGNHNIPTQTALADLVVIANEVAQIFTYTGMTQPSVIT